MASASASVRVRMKAPVPNFTSSTSRSSDSASFLDMMLATMSGMLGTVAVIVRQELVLVIMGGIFVIETLSVMIQVASFKLTGKRVFRMAPIHHHFELKGWPEPRVIVRFWIISVVLVLVGLATLKVR